MLCNNHGSEGYINPTPRVYKKCEANQKQCRNCTCDKKLDIKLSLNKLTVANTLQHVPLPFL